MNSDELALRPLTFPDFQQIRAWPELEEYSHVEPLDEGWWNYVSQTPTVLVHCTCHSDQLNKPLVYSQIDVVDESGWIALVTHPLFRRKGLAKFHCTELLVEIESLGVRELIASIEITNHASIGFFQSIGFTQVGESTRDNFTRCIIDLKPEA